MQMTESVIFMRGERLDTSFVRNKLRANMPYSVYCYDIFDEEKRKKAGN